MKLEFEIDDNLIPKGYTARIGPPRDNDKILEKDGEIYTTSSDWKCLAIILDKKPVLKEIRFTPTGPMGLCKDTWIYYSNNDGDGIFWTGHTPIPGIPLKMEVIWE